MRLLLKFLHLSLSDKTMLLGAWFTLACIRIGILFFPTETLRHFLELAAKGKRITQDAEITAKIAWGIPIASRYLPGKNQCLPDALAARYLLARRGIESTLRLGVVRNASNRLQAHAWLEKDGQVLLGDGEQLADYQILHPIGRRT